MAVVGRRDGFSADVEGKVVPYEHSENATCQLFCRNTAWMLSSSCLRRANPGQKSLRVCQRNEEGCVSITAKKCWGRDSLAKVADFASCHVLFCSFSLNVVNRGPPEWLCEACFAHQRGHFACRTVLTYCAQAHMCISSSSTANSRGCLE